MPSIRRIMCPVCGHQAPIPRGRDYLTCNCGMMIACPAPPRNGELMFGSLTVVALLAAVTELIRRLN